MADLDKNVGIKIYKALKAGIQNYAEQVFRDNPRDFHKKGRITAITASGYSVSIENAEYIKVPIISQTATINVGDTVEICVPNGQISQMFIMGKLVNRI